MSDSNTEWRLRKIEIKYQDWGNDKGKYKGSIQFQNGDHESFKFKIRPDVAQAYIDLIASDVVEAANSLGKRLIDSLGLATNKHNLAGVGNE